MQCQENKKVLDAYVDNELDVMQSVAVEEHLAECQDCARKVEERHAISVAIHNADPYASAPPELVKGVRKALRFSTQKTFSERWLVFKNAAVGFAAAMIVFLLAGAAIGLWFHVPKRAKSHKRPPITMSAPC